MSDKYYKIYAKGEEDTRFEIDLSLSVDPQEPRFLTAATEHEARNLISAGLPAYRTVFDKGGLHHVEHKVNYYIMEYVGPHGRLDAQVFPHRPEATRSSLWVTVTKFNTQYGDTIRARHTPRHKGFAKNELMIFKSFLDDGRIQVANTQGKLFVSYRNYFERDANTSKTTTRKELENAKA
jgi:hypothetical protein